MDDVVRVRQETKGRGGKAATAVRDVQLALRSFGQRLRTACGTGGTVTDGVVELQGDHVERAIELLRLASHTVKRARG